jgi:hypothetical protein
MNAADEKNGLNTAVPETADAVKHTVCDGRGRRSTHQA